MFVRISATKGEGRTYEYLRLVETYREGGKVRQRIVANLGRLDKLRKQGKICALIQNLRRFAEDVVVTGKELEQSQAFTWGNVLVGRKLWDELHLGQIIADCVGKGSKGREVAEAAFVLIASRLCKPSSEHGMARWLEEAYVCDRRGRRWICLWRPFEKVTAEDRVRVEPKQLQFWYRTLDSLVASKKAIEERLYFEIRDLFSMEIDLVFYDITSLYFEGEGLPSLARGGYSRDGKPRNKQIIFGVVMANGFPIATHIFPGNTACKSTVRTVSYTHLTLPTKA